MKTLLVTIALALSPSQNGRPSLIGKTMYDVETKYNLETIQKPLAVRSDRPMLESD